MSFTFALISVYLPGPSQDCLGHRSDVSVDPEGRFLVRLFLITFPRI